MKYYQLSFQKNIRDLGGLLGFNNKKIKYGLLYRGGALAKVNEEDIEIIKSFHLTDIVDFRSHNEFIYHPDIKIEGINYHNFPTFEEKEKDIIKKNEDGNLLWFLESDDGNAHLKKTYKDLLTTKEGIKAYQDFFKVISKENTVTYFHCSQGKDRAGLAAYLLEIALGVNEETALEDYLYSNVAMEDKIERLLKQIENKPFNNEKYRQALKDVFSAKEEYINEAIEVMNNYGGVIPYLENILKVDISLLRKLYLE